MREGGQVGEYGEASVEGGNVWTIYLENVYQMSHRLT